MGLPCRLPVVPLGPSVSIVLIVQSISIGKDERHVVHLVLWERGIYANLRKVDAGGFDDVRVGFGSRGREEELLHDEPGREGQCDNDQMVGAHDGTSRRTKHPLTIMVQRHSL